AGQWGAWLSVARSPGTTRVRRGPSGPNGCYYAQLEHGWVLCSDPAGAVALGVPVPAIDWNALGSLLLHRESRPAPTALSGWREVLPGMMLRLDGSAADAQPFWTPAGHVAAVTVDFDEAAQLVRASAE